MYSVFHAPIGTSGEDPFLQFQWLRRKLTEAARSNRKVWLTGHIPPGIETYAYTQLWHPHFVQEYLSIVQDEVMGSVIAAQLFGHVHKDEIRTLPKPPPGAGPIFLSLSLSPVYYNYPAFKQVTWDENGAFLDYEVFSTQTFSETIEYGSAYSFLDLYGFTNLTMKTLEHLALDLLNGTEQWRRYAKWYTAGYPNHLTSFAVSSNDSPQEAKQKELRRHQYVCAVQIRTQESYEDCVLSSAGKGVSDIFGPKPKIGPLVAAIPTTLSEEDHLLIARLLRWSEFHTAPEAKEILDLAEQHRWSELLQTFRDVMEESWEKGVDMGDILAHHSRSWEGPAARARH